jgi:hypothetical protein
VIPLTTNMLKFFFKVEHCFCAGFRCVLVSLSWLWACGLELQELRVSRCVGITSLCGGTLQSLDGCFHIHKNTFQGVFLLKVKMILLILTLIVDEFHFFLYSMIS